MLRDAGCEYVILGHSERRIYFDETDEMISKKIKMALKNKLKVILCIGENLEQRENNEKYCYGLGAGMGYRHRKNRNSGTGRGSAFIYSGIIKKIIRWEYF